ncbi:hypothetical protein STCU_03319 [Strigomonas culicis]|uniref:Ribosomal protein L9 domain-containing protein n=1 Tax=Strigomonas culicis TaxID=28005 RepID=S9VXE4_9TRYP|nr:hypothetical protein STCU_03319 [Strigomonas culicis]|eukprot:EPY31706.1 hypothetical protein STCU_03319 [Strigomonas culicis]
MRFFFFPFPFSPQQLLVYIGTRLRNTAWMRCCRLLAVAPWVPPPRHDVHVTMPPPPGGEVGGSFGVSQGYSDRLARTPYWKRMALSTYALRMKENETRYPMSAHRPGEYDMRYTVTPYPDHVKHRPLLEVGEARRIPTLRIPVIFLVNLFDEERGVWFGRKYETVYVDRSFAREELLPQRYAIYATHEAYTLLGLPPVNHAIHEEIPKTEEDYKKLLEKQSYDEERWKYSIEYLFRRYEAGPPELLDKSEDEWDGVEELSASSAAGASKGDGAAKRKGPIKQRKARKIKLF